MIIDVNAHLGTWPRNPIGMNADPLGKLLAPFGVTRVYAGRLEALWFENPQDSNRFFENVRVPRMEIVPVPVLDPTVATWPEELDRLSKPDPLPMVRLYPNYHGYALADADRLLAALANRKIVAQVVVRLEDERRQHPLAQVSSVPVAAVADAAERHPGLSVLLSGAYTAELNALSSRLDAVPNLWADTSHADGVGVMSRLIDGPWRSRLVFGSHAPLFEPHAAFARVVLDVDDETATQLLSEQAERLFAL